MFDLLITLFSIFFTLALFGGFFLLVFLFKRHGNSNGTHLDVHDGEGIETDSFSGDGGDFGGGFD